MVRSDLAVGLDATPMQAWDVGMDLDTHAGMGYRYGPYESHAAGPRKNNNRIKVKDPRAGMVRTRPPKYDSHQRSTNGKQTHKNAIKAKDTHAGAVGYRQGRAWKLNGWRTTTATRDTSARPRYGSAIARMPATTISSLIQRPTLFEGPGLFDEGHAIAQDIRPVHSALLGV
ncbi:hypothetical protein C8Q74DRAFT_1221764 [Fomes fomentarius]|nr:hypothetical protein C8Q74DRAFT_1221764 [Fomes fomentarius]